MSDLKEVTLYTDGACVGNPGPGGYGVVLLYGNHRKELSGGFQRTTNNRMEILAAIVGLEALKSRCKVTVYSDSQYVVQAITQGWAARWRNNNWQRNKTEKALNSDLWQRLLELCRQHEVEFIWVKGHADNVENERCDKLSSLAASGNDLAVDVNYEFESQQPNKAKITHEGQACRKCGTPVVKRVPNKKNQKNKTYTYAYYFFCPSCQTMYTAEDAKQQPEALQTGNTLFDQLDNE